MFKEALLASILIDKVLVELCSDDLATSILAVGVWFNLGRVNDVVFLQELFVQLAEMLIELGLNRLEVRNLLRFFESPAKVPKERIICTDLGQLE